MDMTKTIENLLKKLPSVDLLLKNEAIAKLEEKYPRTLIKTSIQNSLAYVRNDILAGKRLELPDVQELERIIRMRLREDVKFSLRRVVNATGTVLHTNLGRSLLSPEIEEHLRDAAFHYSNLEYNLETGKRGTRYDHLVAVIKELTGAEDVLVVNNNAAAVFLALNTLVKEKEVIISRGELVEIGGFFRIPEVISLSKGTIREIGTTNKTHIQDYIAAINEKTGAIMKVHTSNYRIVGFTDSVGIDELLPVAHEHDLPLINDLGSGLFIDMRQFGLPYEPTVKEVLKQGCDMVTFSGDKLLGGPQAGIIAGKKKYISAMKKNQLLRALRVDKMTLAALEATLRLYLDEKEVIEKVPTLKMLALTEEACKKKAETLADRLQQCSVPCEVLADTSAVGGGAYPEYVMPGYVVALKSDTLSANEIEARMRTADMPVIVRIKNDKVYLDVRTIDEAEYPYILQAWQHCFE